MLVFDDRKVSQKELSPHATQGTCSSTPRNHWFCGCVFSCRCQWKKPSSWMGIAWGPPIYPRMCGFSFWDGYPYQKNTCLEHGTYNSANPRVDWKLKLVGNLKNESRELLIRIREVRPDISQWKAGFLFLAVKEAPSWNILCFEFGYWSKWKTRRIAQILFGVPSGYLT